jgi:hypothetical protein
VGFEQVGTGDSRELEAAQWQLRWEGEALRSLALERRTKRLSDGHVPLQGGRSFVSDRSCEPPAAVGDARLEQFQSGRAVFDAAPCI